MQLQPFLFDADLLQQEIRRLHLERKHGKIPSIRKARLSSRQRELIFLKTGGRCHVCGQKLSLDKFEADHVVSHISGGIHQEDNYLPSCFICNNYRWHYLAEELQLILKIGVWAKTQIEGQTQLGKNIALGFVRKESSRMRIGKGSNPKG